MQSNLCSGICMVRKSTMHALHLPQELALNADLRRLSITISPKRFWFSRSQVEPQNLHVENFLVCLKILFLETMLGKKAYVL